MTLNKIKDWHWRIFSDKKDITLFEFIIELKRHFGIRFSPSGFGFDNYPLLIIDFFFISLYITIPFFKNHENMDLTYGIYFYDFDEPHWLPDILNISFGRHSKEYDMPWHIKLYSKEYETKRVKSLKMKSIDNLKTKDTFKYSKNININSNNLQILYYKETYTFKYKILKWFIDKWSKKQYYLNIEYNNNGNIVKDVMKFYKDENIDEMLNKYLNTNIHIKEAK